MFTMIMWRTMTFKTKVEIILKKKYYIYNTYSFPLLLHVPPFKHISGNLHG